MYADDDFVVIDEGRVVVDNRERTDDSLKDFFDRDVKRLYYSLAADTIKIKLYEMGVQE